MVQGPLCVCPSVTASPGAIIRQARLPKPVVTDEDNEYALRPAHVSERIEFSLHALEREVDR